MKIKSLLLFIFALFSLSLILVSPVLAVEDSEAFVTRSGTKFYLNGHEFTFVGFNLFDAAGAGSSPYSCVQANGWWTKMTDAELDSALRYMREEAGVTVLRFWAFQKYTVGATNYAGIDKLITLAKKNGLKLIPVLENGPEHCTGTGNQAKYDYPNDAWYVDGYKVPFQNDRLSYRDYVREIVTRYKDEPTIFGWMMINEADTSRKTSQGKSVLVDFAKDIGGLIKSIDSKHLLTVGTQSNGANGASGPDFVEVYGLPEIDFTEAHDWKFWSGNEADPLPGSADGATLPDINSAACQNVYQTSKVACSIAFAMQVLQKPFVMGEGGAAATDSDASRTSRAAIMDAKMKAAFDNGVAGYIVWQFNTVIDDEGFDVVQRFNDPLVAKMKARAGYQPALPGDPTSTPTPTPTPSATVEPTPPPNACGRADINQDRLVNIADYTILVTNLRQRPFDPVADINEDGSINLKDYTILVSFLGDDC